MASREKKSPQPFLSLHEATFRLGDRLVFENTSWNFRAGEQWAIIGSNGSGKSVFADGLRGCLPLVQGELCYGFRPPPELSPEETIGHVAFEDRKSEVHGTVVQSRWNSFEQEHSLSVRDYLSYERVMDVNPFEVTPRHKVAQPRFERNMRRAVDLLYIEPFLSRTLLSLSNGERQRVQLARALAQPLRLLILDEPYVGLDKATREYFHHVLERLLETRLRVLLITARVEDLPGHISHLLCVSDCRVVAAGPRSKVLAAEGGKLNSSKPWGRGKGKSNRGVEVRRFGRVERPSSGQPGMSALRAVLVEMRDVTVRYGDSVIVDKVTWNIREGESWALLGPNGSGKSTLLSLILGDHPQAYVNEVFVFGRRRGSGESVWHLKKRIGWVSPELQLHFNDAVTVSDAVLSGFSETIGLFERPTGVQIAAANRWLKRFGLSEFADLPLFSLSAGLQRMTLLARALVKKPRLLILDEPCQALDAVHRQLIIETVDGLIRSRIVTAIFVTHRLEEIPPSVKRVLRLPPRRAAS